MKKTNLFPILAVVISAIGSASCTKNYQPDANTLVVALGSQPATLDPRFATDATGTRISGLIFNGLVRVGDDFKVIPEAAESWTLKNRTYTFLLRPDLKFHNGRAVSKEDLLFSWDFYRSSLSPYASSLKNVKSVSAEAKDGRLFLHVELVKLAGSFLLSDLPSIKILPKAEVEESGADFNQVLIGTGPFKFAHQKINEIRLEAVTAKTSHLVFKVIRDDFTRYQKMLKGEVDIAQNELPSEKIGEFETRSDRFQVHKYAGLNMTYVLLNLRDARLQNPSVRMALAESLDREEIIRYKLYGLAEAATSILTPNNPYFNSAIKNPQHNPDDAHRRIEQAGLIGMELVLKTSNTPGAIDGGRVLAHQIEQSGLKIRHESFEWGTYYDDIKKGNFTLATMKWVGTVDPDIYRAAFHSKELPPGRNRGAYKNESVDRLLERGSEEENAETRKTIFLDVQRIVHQDLAILPLWWDRQVAVNHVRVKNYRPVMTSDYWPLTEAIKEP